MAKQDYYTVVLLTYTTNAGIEARAYDQWLREVDNPFFNRIPGIAHYSNWKIVDHDGGPIPFTHFDLLGLTDWDSVESVWFNTELDAFRDGWVEKWGYGPGGMPAPVNCHGYLARRQGTGKLLFRDNVLVAAGPSAVDDNTWRIEEALRMHWAVGRAPAKEPWRRPLENDGSLGFDAFRLEFSSDLPDVKYRAVESRLRWVGRCIAAPEF